MNQQPVDRRSRRPTLVLLFAALAALGAASPTPAVQVADAALLILLDVSGSMDQPVDEGDVKRVLARRGLLVTLERLPAGTQAALRLLGEGPGGECEASRLAVDFGSFDRTWWANALDAIRWDGATPLVHSMREALADLQGVSARRKEMLIIGDGEETCGLDPVGVARAEAGNVRIHTISLGEDTSHQLAGIALVTGGIYTKAYDETSFEAATSDALPDAPVTTPPASAGNDAGDGMLEVILDVSNSMWGQVDGRVKMELAREALAGALGGFPAGMPVGLRAYGHRVSYEDEAGGCRDTELLIAPEPGAADRVVARAGELRPRGQTPIAFALEAAAEDIRARGGGTLLLISDGIESCGGDPVAVAERLRAEGLPVVVHTVGLGVDAAAAAQLRQLAAAGGGEFFDAPSASDLVQGVEVAVRSSTDFILSDQDTGAFPRDIERIAGGLEPGAPEMLEPGQHYSLEEHLFKEVRYFAVAGEPGQRFRLQAMISALAIGRADDGGATYLGYPGMLQGERVDAAGERMRGRGLLARGEMGEWAEMDLEIGPDGVARFSLGRTLSNVHRDFVFRVDPANGS